MQWLCPVPPTPTGSGERFLAKHSILVLVLLPPLEGADSAVLQAYLTLFSRDLVPLLRSLFSIPSWPLASNLLLSHCLLPAST